MASFDPRARRLLALYLAGLSLPEMASQMGESEDAVSAAILEITWETRERLAA